jgi:hypothetical protein
VLWATILAGTAGLLLGLFRFHVLAVVVASVLSAGIFVTASLSMQVTLLTGVLCAFVLLGSLQGGYLAGLLMADRTWSLFASAEWRRDPSADRREYGSTPSRAAARNGPTSRPHVRDLQQGAQERRDLDTRPSNCGPPQVSRS